MFSKYFIYLICTRLLIYYLQHADKAQQSFSSDIGPTLYLALAALEALYKAWKSRSMQPKYEGFHLGLDAAILKIGEYYECTADSDAYTIAMGMSFYFSLLGANIRFLLVLDPSSKDAYFKKHWSSDLHEKVLKNAENIVSDQIIQLI